MMQAVVRKQYTGLDIGKFLCAFLILFYHYFSEHGSLPGILGEALSLYAVAVALFMAISGFLTFEKLSAIEGTANRWAIVKKQALRILRIYAVWSIPYLIFTVSRWDFGSITPSFLFWQVQGWVFRSTFYTIWFMPALAVGLILTFWLTEKLPKWVVTALAVFLYAVGSLTLTYAFLGSMLPGFSVFAEFAETWLGGARGWLFYAFPLLLLGKYMVEMKQSVKWPVMALLSFVFVGAILAEALLLRKYSGTHTGIDLTIMMIPAVFCILGFLLSVNIPSGEYCSWMRKMSTLIFMSQRLFLTVLPVWFSDFFTSYVFANSYLGAGLIFSAELVFCSLIIFGAKKSRALQVLF